MRNIITLILLLGTLNLFSQNFAIQLENVGLSGNIHYEMSNSEFGLDVGFIEKENCYSNTCVRKGSHLKFFYKNYFEGSLFTEGNVRAGLTGIFSNLYRHKVDGGVFVGYKFNKLQTKFVWGQYKKLYIRYEF